MKTNRLNSANGLKQNSSSSHCRINFLKKVRVLKSVRAIRGAQGKKLKAKAVENIEVEAYEYVGSGQSFTINN